MPVLGTGVTSSWLSAEQVAPLSPLAPTLDAQRLILFPDPTSTWMPRATS